MDARPASATPLRVAVGFLLMLVVFMSTAGLSGAEVGIAGGSAVVAQRLLEAIFGDQAVRTLAAKARVALVEKTKELYLAEQKRYDDVLLELQVDHDLRLRRHADALQGLADLFGGEFLDHGDGLEKLTGRTVYPDGRLLELPI